MIRVSPQAPLWARQLVSDLNRELNRSGPLRLARFATADLPSASAYEGFAVWNTTIDRVCVSDGTNWLRQDDGTAV